MTLLFLLLACGAGTEPAPAAPEVTPPEPAHEPQSVVAASPVVLTTAAELAAALKAPSQRPRVVNFWATWCAPCVEELPRLRDWGRANASAELVLVNVDLARLHEPKVLPFVAARSLEGFAHYQVSDRDPAKALEEAVPEFELIVPFTLVIAADGSHRTAIHGAVEVADLERTLAAL